MARSFDRSLLLAFLLNFGGSLALYEDGFEISFLQTSSSMLQSYGFSSPRRASRRDALEEELLSEASSPIEATKAALAIPDADLADTPSSMDLADQLVSQDDTALEARKPLIGVSEKVLLLARESISHSSLLQDKLAVTQKELANARTKLKEAAYIEGKLDRIANVATSKMQAVAGEAKALAAKERQVEDIAKAESDKILSLQQLANVEAQKASLAQRRLQEEAGKASLRASKAEEHARALEEQLRKSEATGQRAVAAMKAYRRREQQVEQQAAEAIRQSRLEAQGAKSRVTQAAEAIRQSRLEALSANSQVTQAQTDAIKARESQAAAEERIAREEVLEATQARDQMAKEIQSAEAQSQSVDDQSPAAPAVEQGEEVDASPILDDTYSDSASSTPPK